MKQLKGALVSPSRPRFTLLNSPLISAYLFPFPILFAGDSFFIVCVTMSAVSNFSCRHSEIRPAFRSDNLSGLTSSINRRPVKLRNLRLFREVALSRSRRTPIGPIKRMAMLDERLSDRSTFVTPADILAYDLVQGADVRWSYVLQKTVPEPPTAVLLHGILGSRKNWGTFARRLAKEFPKWQFLLVDLRCHGDSASLKKRGPHTVASAALDVLKLLGSLKLTPRVVVGHSFGGKVALSMVDQVPKPLARPVRVWVLDATPGKVRAGADGDDHPAELISILSTLPKEVSSKREVVDALVQDGFSKDVAQWVVTNLRPTKVNGASPSSFHWAFDLKGISEMYQSYEETNMWKLVEDVPRGVHVNFLKAERSLHRWALEDLRRIHVAEEQAVEEGVESKCMFWKMLATGYTRTTQTGSSKFFLSHSKDFKHAEVTQ